MDHLACGGIGDHRKVRKSLVKGPPRVNQYLSGLKMISLSHSALVLSGRDAGGD